MLIPSDRIDVVAQLVPYIGEESSPLSVKVNYPGASESILQDIYSSVTLEDFIKVLSVVSQIPTEKLKLKLCEETMTRRLDRKIYNEKDPMVKNTLQDLKVVHNSVFLVEIKDATESEADTGNDQQVK